MDAVVVEVVRGDVAEARHRVHAVAVSNGEIFLRTFKTLWCISEGKKG